MKQFKKMQTELQTAERYATYLELKKIAKNKEERKNATKNYNSNCSNETLKKILELEKEFN